MKNFCSRSFFLMLALGAFLAPAPAQAQNAATIAGMQQDMETLREEVSKLRVEVEDLRLALEKAKSQGDNSAVKQQLNTQNAATSQALQAQKAEITADMDRRFTAMGNETNRAMATLAKQMNDALAQRGSTAAPTVRQQQTAQSNPPSTPSDMPTTGIRYKVKQGDTISGIARANKSKLNWILAANGMGANSTIRIGQEIFIPQRDESPAAATATPAN